MNQNSSPIKRRNSRNQIKHTAVNSSFNRNDISMATADMMNSMKMPNDAISVENLAKIYQ